jgi:4-amino-4-deoxy-L-arabinose transferase-like glycosyltransferase
MAFLRRHAVLLLVLAVAACFRFYALSELPPANYRDVALTGTDALRAASGHPKLHFTYDEGLYADLVGVVFLLFGASDWTLRVPGALFGVLTCWGVFRLGRAFGRERAGLFGAALLAVSFWHVLLSRSGFRAILLPCLLAHSMACLVEALRGGGGVRLVLGGALFGAGVHVYPSVRFAPLILPAYLVAEAKIAGAGWRAPLRRIGWFAVAALVVALPMLVHYVNHPEHFTYPRRVLSVFSPKVEQRDVPAYLEHNLGATLLMFHVHGDENRRHNLSGAPMLDPLTGLLFLAGLVFVLRRAPRTLAVLLVGWLLVMLLPSLLSVEGVPHGLRSCGVLPAVALLSGIGFDAGYDWITRRSGRRPAVVAAVIVVALIGGSTGYRYFAVWGSDPEVALAHDAAYQRAARALLVAPPGTELLLVANGSGFPVYGHPVEAEVYLFEMRDRPPAVLGPKDTPRLVLNGRPARVALIKRDERIVELLRALNPGAAIVELQGRDLSAESPVYSVN